MTQEVALAVLGFVLVPAVGWAIAVLVILRDVKRAGDELLAMHRNPNGYGFGTIEVRELVVENRRLVKNLIHYVGWAAEKLTGEKPPPPLEDGS